MKRHISLRWILLAAGVIAIAGLTAMNVYSLYKLHTSTIESHQQSKKLQVAEFTDKVRYRFFEPFWGLSATDMEQLQTQFARNNQFTNEVRKRIHKAALDPLFSSIYFITPEMKSCQQDLPALKYNPGRKKFLPHSDYPDTVCSSMGKARSQIQAAINDLDHNNKLLFDTHQSATIVFVDMTDRSIFGYLVMPLNQQYLIDLYLPQKLKEQFGEEQNSGMHIWLRDWTKDTIIASSHPNIPYNQHSIQFKQAFPDFFDNWKLEGTFTNSPVVEASNASLIRNLIMLVLAFLILLGALIFMFNSAQRERVLAEQQAGFLANVTHELKTPLSVMQAAGENLSDGRVENKGRVQKYGSHIYNEAIRLRKMIDKLLDVAKADAGQSLIEPKPIKIDQLVSEYIEEHRSYIEGKGFTLEAVIDEDIPRAMIDEDNLETILRNLLENAIKYSHEKKYIGVFLDTQEKSIRLRVKDLGVGMSSNVQAQIFDKFYRAEETLTAKTKGHGLGLSIVKNLVEQNGGTIIVESSPKKGSIFQVCFPILADSKREEPQQQTHRSSKQIPSVSVTP